MSENGRKLTREKIKEILSISAILILCVAMAVLSFVDIRYTAHERRNAIIKATVPQAIGIIAVLGMLLRGGTGLFKRPQKLLYMLPCLLVAVNNFPFHSYFVGKSELVYGEIKNIFWFAVYCLSVGVFEEFVFRGVVFPLFAGYFKANKLGLFKTFLFSSVTFGVVHLFNILAGAGVGPTLLQVGYSTLIGGLCAFALIKTKNLLFPAITHAVYNFCGLLLSDELGLGGGIYFDLPTGLMMAGVGVAVGIFVLWSVWKYPEEEREELYTRLGFGCGSSIKNSSNSVKINEKAEDLESYKNR